MKHTATYSPEDNKLRLYPAHRLDSDEYERVKAAGFRWAPKQELFVAPAWSPEREDLLVDMAGEIGDEDMSLVDRAEARAERFEDLSEKRRADSVEAREAVSAIADNIPLGQPILVGHHSEKHARKDAERIETGMRKAVRMWEVSEYWTRRAKGALRHAKYKELPGVRARRIKGIEADKRKAERELAKNEAALIFWNRPDITEENKAKICRILGMSSDLCLYVRKSAKFSHYDSAWDVLQPDGERYEHIAPMTVSEVQAIALKHYPDLLAHYRRWIAHYDNRLAYERAMLAESGGTVAERKGPEKGGACRCWASEPGAYSRIQRVNKVSVTVLDNWGNGGGNFTRTIPFDKLVAVLTLAEVETARREGRILREDERSLWIAPPQKPEEGTEAKPAPTPAPEPDRHEDEHRAAVEAMRETLDAGGVKVITARNLFPTPPEIADSMVEAVADSIVDPLGEGVHVLEPSAGTGRLIEALRRHKKGKTALVAAVEVNAELASALRARFDSDRQVIQTTVQGDFLALTPEYLGMYGVILMNPPFERGEDIKHIRHAMQFLKPGGVLCALCADGPRQREELRPMAEIWQSLPAGSFSDEGTEVSVALMVIHK